MIQLLVTVPTIANVIFLGFFVKHAWPIWSYTPETVEAHSLVSHRRIYIEPLKFTRPPETTEEQRQPDDVRSKAELEGGMRREYLDANIIVLGFTMNAKC